MKAAVVAAPGQVEVREIPAPVPGEYQALVRTLAGGLCGTDRHIVRGSFYRKTFPGILGHESAGRVVSTGARVQNLKERDLVLRVSAVYPGSVLGEYSSLLGGLAEWTLATDWQAMVEDGLLPASQVPLYYRLQQVLPAGFDPVDAGAFVVLKETLSWSQRLGIGPNSSVLVLGLGPVGLSFVRIAKLLGATNVIAAGRRDDQLQLALRLGGDQIVHTEREVWTDRVKELTGGAGVQFIIDAAGNREMLEKAPACVANFGRIGVYAVSERQEATVSWYWGGPAPRNWSLHFHDPDEAGAHAQALEMVRLGIYDLKATLTHILPLERVAEGIALMENKGAMKVAITVQEDR